MFKDQTVLVAGATGFLGSSITKRLLAQGAKVRGTHYARQPNYQLPGLTWMAANFEDYADCAKATEGVDFVFMCSANTAGAAVMATTPLVHVTPNVSMNARILEAAHRAGVKKFLFFSSGAAYPDLGEDHRLKEEDMFKGDPPPVYYPVGWMKRYSEIMCRTYAEKITNRPMSTVVIRPSNVYGPGDKFDFAKSHVTAAQIRRVIERHQPIQVWGDGTDVRDLIFIEDFLDGVFLAFAKPDQFLTVNIASGTAHSVKDILNTALKVDRYTDARVEYDPTKPRTIGKRIFDTSFAKSHLGWEAKTSLEDGFTKTIEWYRKEFNAPRP
ncbi:MAG TPA: NAD-dependent epimerase/dehydratase family protein [Magnetospirillaceae bacterium]|jgi:GDP-L-fucose synthase